MLAGPIDSDVYLSDLDPQEDFDSLTDVLLGRLSAYDELDPVVVLAVTPFGSEILLASRVFSVIQGMMMTSYGSIIFTPAPLLRPWSKL